MWPHFSPWGFHTVPKSFLSSYHTFLPSSIPCSLHCIGFVVIASLTAHWGALHRKSSPIRGLGSSTPVWNPAVSFSYACISQLYKTSPTQALPNCAATMVVSTETEMGLKQSVSDTGVTPEELLDVLRLEPVCSGDVIQFHKSLEH